MGNDKHQHLAGLVYEKGLRLKIEEEIRSKYVKRIDYLIGANNELCRELEKCEREKRNYETFADNITLDDNF